MKELDYYSSALFKQSNRIEYVRYILLIATISCLAYSIYAHGYQLYAATIAALFFQITSWYFRTMAENTRYLANEFQKISMLLRAYGKVPSEFQISHLKALVSTGISSRVELKRQNDENVAEYNLQRKDNPRTILISMIHENSYWNHHLYREVFFILASGVSMTIAGIVVTSLFALPLIKADPEFAVPRLAFTFLSFSLIYEVLEKAVRSHRSSKIMLEIDNELSRAGVSLPEEHMLQIFNQYCQI